MAKANLSVIILTFLGFVVNLINFALFTIQIPYFFGYLFNTIGTIASVCFFIKAGCIQGIFYRENLEESAENDEIEVVTPDRGNTIKETDSPGKVVEFEVVVDTEIVISLDGEDIGRHKINSSKKGIYLPDNLKLTLMEFKKSKLFCFTFFLYVCLELAMG